jgi:maltooligosyltrehalose trehalohydrolase
MARGDVLMVVNFGDTAGSVPVGSRAVVFETPAGVSLDAGTLSLPPHAGALLR